MESDRSLMALMCVQSLPTAWRTRGEQTLEGANAPVGVSSVFLKIRTCVFTSLHHCYSIMPLVTCISIHVTLSNFSIALLPL